MRMKSLYSTRNSVVLETLASLHKKLYELKAKLLKLALLGGVFKVQSAITEETGSTHSCSQRRDVRCTKYCINVR